jgi:hypothetical protein
VESAVSKSDREALFAKARRASSPTENDRREVRAAIARRLAAGAAATGTTTAAKAAASGAGALKTAAVAGGLSTIAKAALAVVVVGALAGGAAVATKRAIAVRDAPARTLPVSRGSAFAPSGATTSVSATRAPSPVAALPFTDAPVDSIAPVAPTAPAATHQSSSSVSPRATPTLASPTPRSASRFDTVNAPIASASAPASPPPPAPEDATSAAEIALLADVQTALRNGDSARVLALVSEDERRFPASAWVPERDGARALALCAHASLAEARGLGETFASKYPRSPLAGRVRAACKLDVGDPSDR